MTPEKQRIAIAEACGWVDCHRCREGNDEANPHTLGRLIGIAPCNQHLPKSTSFWRLPDYLNDLNAMHEAAMSLSESQMEAFADNIIRMFPGDRTNGFAWINATAAQRAEAFLRTLGKWEDDK